ncbi:DoxX family protein [Novosphingobium gossypii]|uniref:DoxX family protein n=1 Tax=Novosphingobium gossypii TaxID=1604774 RepID=UPI003D213337
MPGWVPVPSKTVMLTGVAEIAGAASIAQPWSPRLRVASAWGLATYALCVWPANVQHMLLDLARPGHGLGACLSFTETCLAAGAIWWPMWASGVTNWPLRLR